ncbi:XAP5-domain-containing protein [Dacryopinax primogenitus]|uniref:XAP5-domain-containing protein n=1 Tax=Dacryopinax primogenitus (strain DJM 731) TaxID=1858805 RepID=M5G8T8_DACPD|nr:XAP5-domain-containing protein [Dacryopinax primogenitus]EJU05149.1 XAP5-domain-containing protein [Dacryopinax primogenitus]
MASNSGEPWCQGALEKKRQEMLAEFERQKDLIRQETEKARPGQNRFVGVQDSTEDALKKSTVGLVQLEEFQSARRALEELKAREAARTDELGKEVKKVKKKRKAVKNNLSFAMDDEEESAGPSGRSTPQPKAVSRELTSAPTPNTDANDVATPEGDEERPSKRPKLGKAPGVDTSFLPDREREEAERAERESLRQEWLQRQEDMKQEEIEVVYSYWDGQGHRKSVICKKGDEIGKFLEKVRQQWSELRGVTTDNLMYIKEDLIIPHHYTFYDFIINKARGKSGPLFNFDVHDDVRLLADATVEKDESHAGKVVQRSWYNRQKHIFPASRWEVYDPEKDYGKYTIKS